MNKLPLKNKAIGKQGAQLDASFLLCQIGIAFKAKPLFYHHYRLDANCKE